MQCGLRLSAQDFFNPRKSVDCLHLGSVEFVANLAAVNDLVVQTRVLCFLPRCLLCDHIEQNGTLFFQVTGHIFTLRLGDVKDRILFRFQYLDFLPAVRKLLRHRHDLVFYLLQGCHNTVWQLASR